MTAAEIIRAAMELVPEEREQVAQTLLASLPEQGDLDSAWNQEISARLDEIRDGRVPGMSRDELRTLLEERRSARAE